MIKLLLADDHTLFREGLKQIFAEYKDIRIKDEAGNGKEVLQKISTQDYDVILLDISLPDLNGLEILRQIKDSKPESKVLILSMYPEDQFVLEAYQTGAAGYVTKSESAVDLLAAIRKVASGGKYVSERAAEKMVRHLSHSEVEPRYKKLSFRENQVFMRIASGETTKQIANELNLSISTVNTLRYRIMKKMSMHSNIEITRYALKNKLVE